MEMAGFQGGELCEPGTHGEAERVPDRNRKYWFRTSDCIAVGVPGGWGERDSAFGQYKAFISSFPMEKVHLNLRMD